MSRPFIQKRIDAELNQIIAERDAVLRFPAGDDRFARLAALFTREAELWGELHEATASTTQARAAIRARQYAQSEAARLWTRVTAQPAKAA